jgi:hypothetical protein
MLNKFLVIGSNSFSGAQFIKYLLENGVTENRFHLFLSNGSGCITDMAFKYDFIYSNMFS